MVPRRRREDGFPASFASTRAAPAVHCLPSCLLGAIHTQGGTEQNKVNSQVFPPKWDGGNQLRAERNPPRAAGVEGFAASLALEQ